LSGSIKHIDEAISARAAFLLEQHGLSNSLQLADALIAATAIEQGLTLPTANAKHYRPVTELDLELFKP